MHILSFFEENGNPRNSQTVEPIVDDFDRLSQKSNKSPKPIMTQTEESDEITLYHFKREVQPTIFCPPIKAAQD